VSKLNAKKIAEASGDIPQNVNFAIRGELAKLFLSQNGISPVLATESQELSPEDLASAAAAYTVLISCYN
jgi:hypothetical protein